VQQQQQQQQQQHCVQQHDRVCFYQLVDDLEALHVEVFNLRMTILA